MIVGKRGVRQRLYALVVACVGRHRQRHRLDHCHGLRRRSRLSHCAFATTYEVDHNNNNDNNNNNAAITHA